MHLGAKNPTSQEGESAYKNMRAIFSVKSQRETIELDIESGNQFGILLKLMTIFASPYLMSLFQLRKSVRRKCFSQLEFPVSQQKLVKTTLVATVPSFQ